MLKIRDDVDLKELEKFGLEIENSHGIPIYEKWFRTIGYIVTRDRIIHKLKDMGAYTDECKITKQDIKRLGIADLVEKV